MFNITIFALLALAIFGSVHATRNNDNFGSLLNEAAVIEMLNNYGTDLNELAEYALGSTCSPASVDSARLDADAQLFVQKYFSRNIRTYLVVQDTRGFTPVTVLNVSVGSPAQPLVGAPAIPNSAALYNWLPGGYAGFFKAFFSRPFFWTFDKPIVTDIKFRDPAFDGATTAYITASNVNEGFACNNAFTANPTRIYRKQQSVYHHVMVLEGDYRSSAWRFIAFTETNKNSVVFPQLPIQVAPAN